MTAREWLTMQTLELRLKQYPPVGLTLRPFFQGSIDVDLAEVLGAAPEHAGIEGLGDVLVWSGLVLGLPFSITAHRRGSRMGFEVALPVRLRDRRIDVSLLDNITALSARLASVGAVYVEHLPFIGEGFGVVEVGSTADMFRSSERDDARTVAQFLNAAHHGKFAVIPTSAEPIRWVVAGPRSGPHISRLEIVRSRSQAEHIANRWSVEFGQPCEIHEGELPPTESR